MFKLTLLAGSSEDPEKTPNSSEAGEQTGYSTQEVIGLTAFPPTLGFEGKFSSRC